MTPDHHPATISIAAMKKDLASIDQQIKELVKEDPHLNELFNLMTSITGVGPVVAVNILVTTDEFKKFETPAQFACYSGVAPFEHTSGKSIRGKTRVSHLANKKILLFFSYKKTKRLYLKMRIF